MKETVKTRIGKNQDGYGYKYTDLAQINEYLESEGMSYYQYTERIENDDYVMTVPIIDGKEQPARRGVKIVDAVLQGIKNPAQEQGSATTYARRYSLLMAFGLATEDDDGQSLTQPTKQQPKKQVASKVTEKQIEVINSLYSEEEIKQALDIVKKEKLEDLTVVEASSLISKRKKGE